MCRRTILKDVMRLRTEGTFITHYSFTSFEMRKSRLIAIKIAREVSGEASPTFFSG